METPLYKYYCRNSISPIRTILVLVRRLPIPSYYFHLHTMETPCLDTSLGIVYNVGSRAQFTRRINSSPLLDLLRGLCPALASCLRGYWMRLTDILLFYLLNSFTHHVALVRLTDLAADGPRIPISISQGKKKKKVLISTPGVCREDGQSSLCLLQQD